ncbi:MAG: protein phosphatase CheZ, partial [Acidobacteriota bacterium]
LSVILTSQSYQDLTGQVVTKIITFQKDMETKLINLIRTFGIKVNRGKKKKDEDVELYGPAHKKMDAAHSQDEIDAILAGFGF